MPNNFVNYVTPEEAHRLDQETEGGRRMPLSHYKQLAKDDRLCEVCEVERVWRFGEAGLCFSCTTGESDASDDYEIILDESEGNDGS